MLFLLFSRFLREDEASRFERYQAFKNYVVAFIVYRKNKRPVGHEQANTDPSILPLSSDSGGGIRLIFIGFGLHSKAGMSDPRTERHRLTVSTGNVNRTASSPGADVRAIE